MSWKEELLRLYDRNSSQAGCIQYREYKKNGKIEKHPYVLLPLYHGTAKAHIQVTISQEGNFMAASRVEKDDSLTMIPMTEKSGSRTSTTIAPHALCDSLKYLAGDYGKYVPDVGEKTEECYEAYMQRLEQWHMSLYTHEKVDAVYNYLKKKTLLFDLIQEKVLVLDGNGFLSEKVKLGTESQSKAFVRFVIRSREGIFASEPDECWRDKSLQERFIQYSRSFGGRKELDYLTGEYQIPTYLHPKKIRNEGDGAKLISANDETYFTFRGRFATKEEAFCIGNETSQKLHNALRWIIGKQGRSYDTLMIVTWESEDRKIPFWDFDTEAIVSPEEEVPVSDENPITARQLYSALEGCWKRLENTSKMFLMVLDAATTGRLCLAEYKELETARYLDNIRRWHEQGGWLQYKFKDKQRISYYGIPGIRDIADILYGIESGGRLMIVGENGKKLYGELSRRLLPCIWDGRCLPMDLVNGSVNKASMPQCYTDRYNWERVLALACSFVKKSRYERHQKEEWDVALKEECTIRDYLYGRLLAVADRIEYRTYDMDKGSGRVTNARRYMSTFSQRPFETWKIIEENLQPYLNKLPAAERRYYEKLLDDICRKFDVEDFQRNQKLDGLYLLGFHSQSFALREYKKEIEYKEEETE